MGDTLKVIRDLTIIIAIYLYFIAWAYIHFYYQQFGISTDAIKVDYNSYLMYSYNVLSSPMFLNWIKSWFWIIIAILLIVVLIRWFFGRYNFFKRSVDFLSNNFVILYLKKLNLQTSLLVFVILSGIVFPKLFKISRQVAIDQYVEDRFDPRSLKSIQFIFRKDADLLSPAVVLDSSMSTNDVFYYDIALVKKDDEQLLRLLGESDKYYIVLQQRPFNSQVGSLPTGYVYFIDKKDILLSKTILRSVKKN